MAHQVPLVFQTLIGRIETYEFVIVGALVVEAFQTLIGRIETRYECLNSHSREPLVFVLLNTSNGGRYK